MLVKDMVCAILDYPLGGCVGPDAVMAQKGAKKLDGPRAATRSAPMPVIQRDVNLPEEFHPKGDHAPGANYLRVPTALMEDQQIQGRVAMTLRDPHAGEHMGAHLLKMALGDVMALVPVEASPINNRRR